MPLLVGLVHGGASYSWIERTATHQPPAQWFLHSKYTWRDIRFESVIWRGVLFTWGAVWRIVKRAFVGIFDSASSSDDESGKQTMPGLALYIHTHIYIYTRGLDWVVVGWWEHCHSPEINRNPVNETWMTAIVRGYCSSINVPRLIKEFWDITAGIMARNYTDIINGHYKTRQSCPLAYKVSLLWRIERERERERLGERIYGLGLGVLKRIGRI